VRRGIRDLLETEAGILVVGEAANGKEAIAQVENFSRMWF
jgi:YesN/AraC family two-component response regulator